MRSFPLTSNPRLSIGLFKVELKISFFIDLGLGTMVSDAVAQNGYLKLTEL